ncbi:putative P-type ATPase [Neospora caninum Liverpool]|uniref:P-type ATPase, putative n=1 Tax=Neospora caninum (strain Liverpool) TaxID=572307 RepID=F0VQ56_NEOCL|nr:putative P-type ATPase [Neospora caninum Liverpool]CBZ55853.1 putative P-type ATPase [Neospora caninum Liverpool]CEL70597.1 TPA: P-type ATPase, putative [Neospora caninum Liverpool]|eukprot:XP_003885879.1 putative P-type ATPase [Neospora caninum Liverpool]
MGLWGDICPLCFWGMEWLWSVLPSRSAVVRFLPRCLPCLRPCFKAKGQKRQGDEEEALQKHVGTLCVRTHTPSSAQPESPGNSHFHVAKWTNVIRTTQYTWWNFLPKNLWSQISQPANFYFLVMAVMQMVPQISDSDGLPTFLFPLTLVMVITAAKDAYENVKRTRADQEENNRLCRVVNASGEVDLVPWKHLRPGNIVKLQCDEAVPADILLLNCADEYGVAYVETVQLDGETNLKHKMCIPEIADMVRKDHDASVLSLEISYEPPSAELYKFSGVVTLNPPTSVHGRQSVLSWGRASLAHLHTGNTRLSPRAATPQSATPQSATPGGSAAGSVRANSQTPRWPSKSVEGKTGLSPAHASRRYTQGVDWEDPAGEELEAEKKEEVRGGGGKMSLLHPTRTLNVSLSGLLSRQSSNSLGCKKAAPAAVSRSALAVPRAETMRPPSPQRFSVDISQFLWRGSTVRNTAWAYGVVLYTGQHTRIMKNTRTRELKYSRLQVYYNQHALLLAIAQFLLCLIAALAFASHNQNMSDNAWYLESLWESGVGNFFASLGVSFGQYVLLLSYFVPITLLVQLEMCRACQAGFLSVDDRMFCPATGQKASAQSVALMEELGSITHVFSDKTGTLTQNLMQFRCLAVGDTLHGFDEYQEMKSFVSHSSVVSSMDAFECAGTRLDSGHSSATFRNPRRHDAKGRYDADAKGDETVSPNKYVHFNARLFANRMLRASKTNQQKAADILMVMALCHSVLPKQDSPTPGTNPLAAERMPMEGAGDRSRRSSSVCRHLSGEPDSRRPGPGEGPSVPSVGSKHESFFRLPSQAPNAPGENGESTADAKPQGGLLPVGEEVASRSERQPAKRDGRGGVLRSASLVSGKDEEEEGQREKPLSASARVAAAPPASILAGRLELEAEWAEEARRENRKGMEEEQGHYFEGTMSVRRSGASSGGLFLSLPLASPGSSNAPSERPSPRENSCPDAPFARTGSAAPAPLLAKGCRLSSAGARERADWEILQDGSESEKREGGLASHASSLFSPDSSLHSEEVEDEEESTCQYCSNCMRPLELDSDEEDPRSFLSEASASPSRPVPVLSDVSWPSLSPPFGSTLSARLGEDEKSEEAAQHCANSCAPSCVRRSDPNAPRKPEAFAVDEGESGEEDQRDRDCVTLRQGENRTKYIREEPRHEAPVTGPGVGSSDPREQDGDLLGVDVPARSPSLSLSLASPVPGSSPRMSSPSVGRSPSGSSAPRGTPVPVASVLLPSESSPFPGGNGRPAGQCGEGALERREDGGPGGALAVQLAAVKLTKEAEYDASSPDELALTAAAKHLGAEFLCRPSLSTIQLCLTSRFAEDCLLSRADKAYLERLRQKIAEQEAAEGRAETSEERQEQPSEAEKKRGGAAGWGHRFLKADRGGEASGEGWQKPGAEGGAEKQDQASLVPLVVFDVLEVLEFDNFRKRMSVVIRDRTGRLRLLVKGADSSMLDIAAPGQEHMKQELKAQLAEMASQGLRTLVMGQRYLSEQEFDRYRTLLLEAKARTGDRKEEAMNVALSEIERNIELLGASGIDDKLQDQVAETISDIKQAGVKLWVLTGDKMETAIAIGHSCSILTDATYNAIVDGTSEAMVKEQLHQYMSYIVAAQLASEAFEQIALKSMVDRATSEISDVSSSAVRRGADPGARGPGEKFSSQKGGSQKKALRVRTPGQCIHCLAGAVKQKARCVGRRAYEDSEADSVRARRARHAPPSMPWEEFVKILTFNANRKVVKADPKQRKNKRLSPAQVEDIVQEYLEHFDKSSEENQKERSKRGKFASGKTSRPSSGAVSSLQNAACSSGYSRFGNRKQASKGREKERGQRGKPDKSDGESERDAENGDGRPGRSVSLPAPQVPEGSEKEQESEDHAGEERDPDGLGRGDAAFGKAASHASEAFSSCELSPQESSCRAWGELDSSRSDKLARDDQNRSSKHPLSSADTNSVMREAAVEGYEACAITITGEALTHALSTAENRRYFFGLANLCSTVIACRVSPKQKSDVVMQCKRYQSGTVSLGIGDGANDVGMLVAANVGVGIRGKEGLQAVRAADFAIGEFKFVRNLMFCHGREALRRNAFQMYQTIFKNVVFGLADLFFAFVSVFAASDMFNPWLKQLYNVLYTCIPVMLFTVFDRQLPYDVLLQTPVLYPAFSKLGVNMFAGTRTFWKWLLFGFYVSAALVYFPLYGMGWGFAYTGHEGIITFPLAFYGAVVFWCIILVCNLVMVPFLHTWFWFIWLGIFVDFGFWWLSLEICPRMSDTFCTDLAGSVEAIHQDPRYYFACIIAVFVALFPQYLIWFFKVAFRPSAPCVIRERIAKGVFDVVIAPRGGQKMAVVVPKKVSNEWRGFAFAEQDHTRWGQHRRSMRAVLEGQPSQSFLPEASEVNPSLSNRLYSSVLPESAADNSPLGRLADGRDVGSGSAAPLEQRSLARRFSGMGTRSLGTSGQGAECEKEEKQSGKEELDGAPSGAVTGESLANPSARPIAANDARPGSDGAQ